MVQPLIRMPGCNHVEAYSYTIEELCIPFGGSGWREESLQEGFLFILLIPASLDYPGFTTTWAWISNRMSIIKDWSCMFTVTSSHKILAVFTQRSCNTAAKKTHDYTGIALLHWTKQHNTPTGDWYQRACRHSRSKRDLTSEWETVSVPLSLTLLRWISV